MTSHVHRRWRRLICLLVLGASTCIVLGSASASARRVPSPGGKVVISLPPELVAPTTEAHLFAPLVEPVADDDAAAALARPHLPGLPSWRSSVLRALTSEDGGKVWRLGTDAPATLVGESIARCLSATTASATTASATTTSATTAGVPSGSASGTGASSWPADVLRARRVTVDIATTATEVRLRFSDPVGPLPELLAGCALRTSSSGPTGGYALVAPGVLAWKSGSFGPPALPGLIEVASLGMRADVASGAPEAPGTATLLAPFPDVLLLLQTTAARDRDPFALKDPVLGTRAFHQALRAELLAAAYAQGRGASTEGILPPGVAPARPLPPPRGADQTSPLSLSSLPPDAPRLVVRRVEGDQLVDGLIERLAVLLRNRGILVDLRRLESAPADGGVEILRWRAPTSDPALALLALAGERPSLAQRDAARRALADPRLLSASRDERMAAALTLERAWLDENVVVPLMTADRWFVIDPDLRGVQIREDGVPLLFDATFAAGGAPELGGSR